MWNAVRRKLVEILTQPQTHRGLYACTANSIGIQAIARRADWCEKVSSNLA